MVNIQSLCVAATMLGSYAAALPTNIVPINNGVIPTIAERCIPDDPISCGAGFMKREISVKRCIPDDPTSCDPGDFGKRDIPVKRCIPNDPTSCDLSDSGQGS
ncbi:hypothetical protein BDV38DRAFT_190626 [Aspergillus pseudotamarii]|uniref:Chitin-binding type-2 domain-containing protein n=1 Tax=Aspergillus pseudotamarii TaxID=132259 RepID=A0A5N6T641_ASPPS|nr:uncharacterized protein BDV38DRAFT_190626 [Aspergillus pseudotamarii]KAE8141651.1 hypothetical protein BDV38DRAFT_190626 [Aspergillus pseudotamarii]